MPHPRNTGFPIQVQLWVIGNHTLLNQTFGALLAQLPGVEIAGQATSLEENPPQSLDEEACLVLWILPVIKDFEAFPVMQILRQVVRGEICLPQELARDLILSSAIEKKFPTDPSYDSLTSKEKEILPLLCQGLSNKRIAQIMYLSVRKVENFLARIYGKFVMCSRTEVAVLAIQNSWVNG